MDPGTRAMGGEQAHHTLFREPAGSCIVLSFTCCTMFREPAGYCIVLSFHPTVPPQPATNPCFAALLQATPCATMQ